MTRGRNGTFSPSSLPLLKYAFIILAQTNQNRNAESRRLVKPLHDVTLLPLCVKIINYPHNLCLKLSPFLIGNSELEIQMLCLQLCRWSP